MYRCGKKIHTILAALGIRSAVEQVVVNVKYLFGDVVRVIIVVAVFGCIVKQFLPQVFISLKVGLRCF